MNKHRILLWDLPTRLFHWLLVAAVTGAIITGQLGGGLIDWHGRFGLLIVGLVSFRLVWGVVGSSYARFAQFFPTPGKIRAYFAGQWHGEGHNPLGALSVLGLILLLSTQVLTGLFANDDITFSGPLFDLVSKSISNRLTGLHHLLSNLLIALVVLHIAAIVFYVRIRKKSLLKPMITGWKETSTDEATKDSAKGGGLIAFIVAVMIAGAAVYAASGAWLPEPPPAAVDTPNW